MKLRLFAKARGDSIVRTLSGFSSDNREIPRAVKLSQLHSGPSRFLGHEGESGSQGETTSLLSAVAPAGE